MEEEKIDLDKNNPDSIYNWLAKKITSPSFRNIIKDFIDDNCSLFIDVDENTFQQGQLFNEFTQLIENILGDLLTEGGITQEQFLAAAERGLNDKKYKKYFDQLLNFSEYNYFKKMMTKRNYQIIKKIEESMALQQNEKEIKQKEEMERKQSQNRNKTEREIEEEKQRRLLHQFLNQEEEEELQKAIQKSLELEDEKRKIAIIEEEELKRALKQSLLDSVKAKPSTEEKKPEVKNEEKKSEAKIEEKKSEAKIEEKKPKQEPKKEEFIIDKNEEINFEKKEKPKAEAPTVSTNANSFNIISNNTNFQFSGTSPKEVPQQNKPTNIISASKGFEFQIESKKNDFGISSMSPTTISNTKENPNPNARPSPSTQSNPYARPSPSTESNPYARPSPSTESNPYARPSPSTESNPYARPSPSTESNPYARPSPSTDSNPYARPSPSTQSNLKVDNSHIIKQDLIDIKLEPKSKEKKFTNDTPLIENKINENENKYKDKKDNKKSINLLQFEDNTKEEKIEVTKEIKTEKASDIIKNTLNENKIKDDENDGGLLIDDDEEDASNYNPKSGPKTNTFINKKEDVKLGNIRFGKDGGNFINNFRDMSNYERGGMENLENKFKEGKITSVVQNQNEDEDYQNKLREVENEKQAKLRAYREYLLKMKKEKRENKAKEVLSPEELAKLESKKRLAEQLKAKRK